MTEYVRIPCECKCCTLEFSKDTWEDEVTYHACVMDSYYDHEYNGILGRIKRALMALLGKPVYFNDVVMTPESFDVLIAGLEGLRDE